MISPFIEGGTPSITENTSARFLLCFLGGVNLAFLLSSGVNFDKMEKMLMSRLQGPGSWVSSLGSRFNHMPPDERALLFQIVLALEKNNLSKVFIT